MGEKDRRALRVRGEQQTIAALIVLFWLAFQVVFFTYNILADRGATISAGSFLTRLFGYIILPLELAIVGVGIALCFLIYCALRGVRGFRLWQQLFIAALVAFVGAACFTVSISVLCGWFRIPWPALTMRFFFLDTMRWLAPFGLWAGVTLTVTYNSEMRDRERRLALLQAKAQEAQMRALRYQVNPHLLYNTLNSIAALILDGRNQQAEEAVLRLSSFFRASLSNDPESDVTLADEIALQKIYLDIEQMRFPQLSVEFAIPEELGNARVPSLILQPLIENALKHGINPDCLPTHLRVAATKRDGKLVVEVSDNGPGTSAKAGTGVGLGNVRERLVSRFGDGAGFETHSEAGKGFTASLTIPL